ncbi:hypothetical protein AGMMS50225_06290 [Betaproteobacteria bacterium]|nr:hypothetical protein AGMMS50225_06290 [Betaproteobacteria bacterium]
MTTLHILLASGENLPNLIPAIAPIQNDASFKAGAVLILTSAAMRTRAQILKYGLEATGLKNVSIYPEDCPDHGLVEITNWAEVRAKEIAANYYDDRRILNLTGGNKLMTIAFLEAFQNRGFEIVYCDTEHHHIEYIRPLERRAPVLPVNILKLPVYLAAQGYQLREEHPDVTGIQAREALTRKLVADAPGAERLIRALNQAFFEYNDKNNLSASVQTERLNAKEKELLQTIRESGLIKPSGFQNEAAAGYLGGGWLEEWCWIIGKELEQGEPGKRLQDDRWGINLKIDPAGQAIIPGRNQYSLNELDAVFVHRNRMLLIECKTGAQISEAGKGQNILNKLETLGKHVSGRLDTKWLLTARRIDRNSQVLKRAEGYQIRIIAPEDLIHLKEEIQKWMTR